MALTTFRKDEVERWSYGELADTAARLSRGLQAQEVKRGDTVALYAANAPLWIAACLAVLRSGAVVVPIDAQLSGEELEHVLKDSGAHLVFTTSDKLERLQRLEVQPILFDIPEDDARSWRRVLGEPSEATKPDPEDTAALFYTSGTTGAPKGVPLSHRNLASQLETILKTELFHSEDTLLLPLPLHHVYPFVIGMLLPLAVGAPIVLPAARTGPELVRALNEGEVSAILGVPRLYEALFEGIRSQIDAQGWPSALLLRGALALSTSLRRRFGWRLGKRLLAPLHARFGPKVRLLASGGSALDPELAWQLEGLGWPLAIGYGLTETSPLLTVKAPDDLRLGSVGKPVESVELRLDEAQASGEREGEGEVLARGPSIFSGYRNLPDKSEEVLGAGWFRTGDLGYFEDDHLFITGRVSTLIVTEGGENLQPDRVEAAYEASPVIREVGVLKKGRDLVGVIVPGRGEARQRAESSHLSTTAWTEQAVSEAVKERSKELPSYARLADFVLSAKPLPRTRLGKLRRHLLEERFDEVQAGGEEEARPVPVEEMAEEDQRLLENRAVRSVWDLLASRYEGQRLAPETDLQLELGVDSLEWVNLTLEISERAGVELDEETAGRLDTVRDLLREVGERTEDETGGETGGERTDPLDDPEGSLNDEQRARLTPLSVWQRALARPLLALNGGLMRTFFGLEVVGLEHLPDEGPIIFTPNHASYLDPFVLAAALGAGRLGNTFWVGSRESITHNPVNRGFTRLAQAVPISDRAATASLAVGAAALGRGHSLIWFPEGQRSPTGDLQRFRPGVGLLLAHAGVPAVPVYIAGTWRAMPPGSLPRPARVMVAFGEPQTAGDLEDLAKNSDVGEADERPHERVAAALKERVAALKERVEGNDYSR